MNWEPWEEFKHLKVEQLDVAAPPCPACEYWKPVPRFTDKGEFDGVRLCHGEQQQDFSCYRKRYTAQERRILDAK